jgi:polar amino acid transport system ATP-binding protein
MTIRENITLAPIKVQGKSRDEANELADGLLKRFDLMEKANEYPDRLSGGQQQRAAIIRSIAVNPRLLLLDEVTSALDPVLVNEVLSIVRDLKSDGMTMVLATHEMGFATQVADQVCFLESGLILERGTPEQVLKAPSHQKTKEFLKRVHEAGRL